MTQTNHQIKVYRIDIYIPYMVYKIVHHLDKAYSTHPNPPHLRYKVGGNMMK